MFSSLFDFITLNMLQSQINNKTSKIGFPYYKSPPEVNARERGGGPRIVVEVIFNMASDF